MANEIYRGPAESPRCAECPCSRDGQAYRPIRGAGSVGGLAIVGEGPSTEEIHQGWPFVGPSGKLLQQVFNEHGIDRHSLWITNAILCQRPYKPEALAKAIECCRPRLENELALVKPKAVCALGGSAAQSLVLPVTAITDARGTAQASPLLGTIPVVTALHPAAILRGGGADIKGGGKQKMNVDAQYVFLSADVAKAHKLATIGLEPWSDDVELIIDTGMASMHKILRMHDAAMLSGFLAIDLEWGKDGMITWLGLAAHDKAQSNDFNAISLYWPILGKDHRIAEALWHVASTESVAKLFHNLQADVKVWEAQIGPVRGVLEDTMLMHHAAYPGAAHDLQNVASQFLNVPPWKALRAGEEKLAKRAAAKQGRLEAKALKKAQHDAANAESHAAAVERKRARKAKGKEVSTEDLLKLLGE